MKLATWNVNSLRVRLEQVQEWLRLAAPDVLGLQETKLQDHEFPRAVLEGCGYHVHFAGQRTYNGVALLSREPMHDVVTGLDGFPDEQRRVLAATVNGVRVWNLYVPNGQRVGSEKYEYKLQWLAALERTLAAELAQHEYLAVMGDFNIAPGDEDVHDPKAWEGKVLCSEPEREALRRLQALGLQDVFTRFEPQESRFTWWDYRAAAFRRNLGLRIDLILASAALAERCVACSVDVVPRRWERPSDHAPVSAEFAPPCAAARVGVA